MKTKYFESGSKPDTLIDSLTGKEYPYRPSDKASRQAALAHLATDQESALQEMREKRPGLTDRQHFGAPVNHPDPRTDKERRAAAPKQQQPSGIPAPVDPHLRILDEHAKLHGPYWLNTDAGKRFKATKLAQSKQWQAEQQTAKQQQEFEQSIAPAVDHATKVLDGLQRDPSITVAELELAQSRVQLARDGRLDDYATADREWRETQKRKLEDAAVEVDSEIRKLQAQRESLTQAAYEPVNTEPQLVPVSYPDFYHDPAKAGKTIMEPLPQ